MTHASDIVLGLLQALLLQVGLFGGVGMVLRRLWNKATFVDVILSATTTSLAILCLTFPILSRFHAIRFDVLAVGILLLFLVGLLFRFISPQRHEIDFDIPPNEKMLAGWLALGLATWAAVYFLMRGLVLPVETVSDAPIYHLAFAARWWQSGSLESVATPFGELAATYFPANGEIWLTWLWISGSGEWLAKAGQWPFLLVSAIALFGLCRQIGASANASLFPPAFWACTFLALYSSSLANVDLIFGAFYLSAVYFLVRFWRDSQETNARWHLLFFGCAAGLALGTKSIGLLYVAVLFPVALLRIAWRKSIFLDLTVVATAMTMTGGYWYARNAWLTGNPLYPLQVTMLGMEWLPGWYGREAMQHSGYHVVWNDWQYLAQRLATVLDLRLWPLWGLSLSAALWALPRRQWLPALLVGLGALLGALYWFVVPYNTQERFLLPALGCGLVPLALLLERWRWLQWPMVGLLAWHLLSPQWVLSPELSLMKSGLTLLPVLPNPLSQGSAALALILPFTITAAILVIRSPVRGRWLVATTLVAFGVIGMAWPTIRMVGREPVARFYPGTDFAARLLPTWLLLESARVPEGSHVAYAGTNLPYYLLGSQLKNQVRYVNVAGAPTWLPHDFARKRRDEGNLEISPHPWPNWYRDQPDYQTWLNHLDAANIDFLFVARENQHAQLTAEAIPPFPIEEEWARSHPDRFERIGQEQQSWAKLYRVLRPKRP